MHRPALLAFLAAILLVLAVEAWRGWPVAVPEPAITRLDCVSYAHPGPLFELGERRPIAPETIDRELAALAEVAGCVRTYSTDDGQDVVVAAAARHGLSVIQGAWLSRDPAKNASEAARAVALANAHPDTVRAVVLGNEVLLRREMTVGDLVATITAAQARTTVPVTTAEIWSFWLDHPELATAVDILTVHVLPYWDGAHIASLDDALAFSAEAVGKVAARYPGKPILIGEIGWPSVGRARGAVTPGIVTQARFARGIAALAAERGWAFNVIEGYDQPWKRRGEGTIGGAWGLLHADGTPKAPLSGPVSNHPVWWLHTLVALVLGGAATAWWQRRARTAGRAALVAGIAPVLALLLVEQAAFSLHAVAHWHEAVLHPLAWLASAVVSGAALAALARGARVTVHGTAAVLAVPPVRAAGVSRALSLIVFLLRLGAASLALGLVLDPRYRDFAIWLLLPAAVTVPWALRPIGRGREDTALGLLLAVCGLAALLIEGWANPQAWGWLAVTGLLALPLLPTHRGQQAEHDGGTAEAEMAEG